MPVLTLSATRNLQPASSPRGAAGSATHAAVGQAVARMRPAKIRRTRKKNIGRQGRRPRTTTPHHTTPQLMRVLTDRDPCCCAGREPNPTRVAFLSICPRPAILSPVRSVWDENSTCGLSSIPPSLHPCCRAHPAWLAIFGWAGCLQDASLPGFSRILCFSTPGPAAVDLPRLPVSNHPRSHSPQLHTAVLNQNSFCRWFVWDRLPANPPGRIIPRSPSLP